MPDFAQIIEFLSLGLTIAFWAVLASLLISFLWGLLHGWRYAVYRLLVYALWILVMLLSLDAMAGVIGDIDLSFLGTSISFSYDAYVISVPLTTPFATMEELIEQTLIALGTTLDPASLTAYATSLTSSLLKIFLLIAYGLLLITLINWLTSFFWYVMFRWFFKAQTRKRKLRKGRIWNALTAVIISLTCGCMVIFPLSAIINTINQGVARVDENGEKLYADDSTYGQIVDVLDAYENSIFAQAFFNWTAGSGKTFDAMLIEALTASNIGGTTVSFVTELSSVVSIASNIMATGVDFEDSTQGEIVATMITSESTPQILYSLAGSQLVTTVMPYAFQVATNITDIGNYLRTVEGIDSTSEQWEGTFEQLAALYQAVFDSGALEGVNTDEAGNLGYNTDYLIDFFQEETREEILEIFDSLDDGSWELLENILDSLAYVACANEVKNPSPESDTTLSISDFMPESTYVFKDGIPVGVTDEFKDIKWGNELTYLYDFVFNAVSIDSQFLNDLIASLVDNSGEIDLDPILSFIANHPQEISELMVGDLNEIDPTTGKSDGDTSCLFDSDLIINGLDKVLQVLASTINESLGEGNINIDMDSVVEQLDLENRVQTMINYKGEFHALLGVMVQFLDGHPDAVKLMEDFDEHPGIYIDPNGKLVSVNDDLYDALVDALNQFDESLVATAILPPVIEYYVEDTGIVADLLGEGALPLDFNADNLGSELASLIRGVQALNPFLPDLQNLDASDLSSSLDTLTRLLEETVVSEGEAVSVLSYLLDLVADSKILNPDTTDAQGNTVINTNYAMMMDNLFSFGSESSIFSVSDFQNIDTHAENVAIADTLIAMNDTGLLQYLLSDAASTEISSMLRVLTNISREDFVAIFASIGESFILENGLSEMFDTYLLPTLFGEDSGISFHNVTDWTKEGDGIYSLLVFASEVGDLSNIDFFNSDPESIEGILKVCANSQLFKSPEGEFLFPEFIYETLTSSIEGTEAEDFLQATYLDTSSSKQDFAVLEGQEYDILKESLLALDTPEAWDGESAAWCDLIALLQSFGGFDAIASISSLSPYKATEFLDALSECDAFGKLILTRLVIELRDAMGDSFREESGYSRVDNANVAYLFDNYGNLEIREAELKHLKTLAAAVLDPCYGLIENGQIVTDMGLSHLDPEYLVRPVFESLLNSNIFNTLYGYDGTSARTELTAAEGLIGQWLSDSGLYGSSSQDDVDGYLLSIDPTLSDHSLWNEETNHLVTVLEIARDGGFIDDEGNINMSCLSDIQAYFSGNPSSVQEKKDTLKALLLEMDSSKLLFPALLVQIKANIETASIALGGVSLDQANFDYVDPDLGYGFGLSGYLEEGEVTPSVSETDLLVEILYGVSQVTGTTFANTDETISLLVYLHSSHIFNTVAEGQTLTFFQSTMISVMSEDVVAEYIFNERNPKIQAVLADHPEITDSDSYIDYLVSEYYFPATWVNPDGSEISIVDYPQGNSLQRSYIDGKDGGLGQALAAIVPLIKDGSFSIEDLSSDEIYTVLTALNSSELLYDLVPNIIDNFLTQLDKDYGASSEIDFSLAYPFFNYYFDEDSASMTSEADWSRRYPASEIEAIASCVEVLDSNSELLNPEVLDYISPIKIHDTMMVLAESYVFHRAGPNPANATAIRSQIDVLPNNLTVLEQMLFTFFSSKGFASFYFDEVQDALFMLSLTNSSGTHFLQDMADLQDFYNRTPGTTEAEYYYDLRDLSGDEIGGSNKLYDSIISLRAEGAEYILHEIQALTIGSDSTTKGFIEAWQDSGMSSSSLDDVSSLRDVLDTFTPEEIESILSAINDLKTVAGSVAFQTDYLISAAVIMEQYTLYESDLQDFISGSSISITSDDIGRVETISLTTNEMVSLSDFTLIVHDINRENHSFEIDLSSLVGENNAFTIPIDEYGAYGFDLSYNGTSSSLQITSCSALNDVSDFYFREAKTTEEARVRYQEEAIPILVDALQGLEMQPTAEGESRYFSFDITNPQGFLEVIAAIGTEPLLKFIGASGGFYATPVASYQASGSQNEVSGRAVVFSQLLDINYSVTYLGISYSLSLDMSSYFNEGYGTGSIANDALYNLEAAFGVLEDASQNEYSYPKEGAALDSLLPSLIALKSYEEATVELSQQGFSTPRIGFFLSMLRSDALLRQNFETVYPYEYEAYATSAGSKFASYLYAGLSMDIATMNAEYGDYSVYSTHVVYDYDSNLVSMTYADMYNSKSSYETSPMGQTGWENNMRIFRPLLSSLYGTTSSVTVSSGDLPRGYNDATNFSETLDRYGGLSKDQQSFYAFGRILLLSYMSVNPDNQYSFNEEFDKIADILLACGDDQSALDLGNFIYAGALYDALDAKRYDFSSSGGYDVYRPFAEASLTSNTNNVFTALRGQ